MPKFICVYCSSSNRLDSKYLAAADALGRAMVARGWSLIYGGGHTGLMGSLAHAVKSAGGTVVGVIPEFMKLKELAFEQADELVTVATMRERKQIMETRADAFIALPGGWGTLEELMEVMTLRQLDLSRKPCVIYNQDGFYEDLLRFFDKMVEERFNKPSTIGLFRVATTVDELLQQIEDPHTTAETKWFETR